MTARSNQTAVAETERRFFSVYEAQEVTDWLVYEYLVEATDYEAAVEAVREGDADSVYSSYCGEPDFGRNAYGRDRIEAVERLGALLEAVEQSQDPSNQPAPTPDEPESGSDRYPRFDAKVSPAHARSTNRHRSLARVVSPRTCRLPQPAPRVPGSPSGGASADLVREEPAVALAGHASEKPQRPNERSQLDAQ